MVVLWQPEGVTQDRWVHLADQDDYVSAPQTVSWERWQKVSENDDGLPAGTPIGVRLPQDIAASQIGPIASAFSLIVIDIELPEDGRHYSIVRQLRERYQYAGSIRAAGDVAVDQLRQMLRCGYSEFVLDSNESETLVKSVLHRRALFQRSRAVD